MVPGYGPTDAHFHVVGDPLGVHGGLVDDVELSAGNIETSGTFFSYSHACDADGEPLSDSYDELEPYFDAKLRAIRAHVLLPVGEQATAHVFEQYTAIDADRTTEMADLYGADHHAGWLVVPVAGPAGWSEDDEQALVECLRGLLDSDYRQSSDLGRFPPDDDPHVVR